MKNTHKDYKAMQLYNQLNVYRQNNINGRYNSKIKEVKKQLEIILNEIEVKNRLYT